MRARRHRSAGGDPCSRCRVRPGAEDPAEPPRRERGGAGFRGWAVERHVAAAAITAVSAFYAHQARHGAEAGGLLAVWKAGGRGGWKPFLHHISRGGPCRGRAIALKAPKKLPRILSPGEMQAILDACTRLRDRFFFALLYESGCRAGEVPGLRHEDIAAAECEISIVARENANGARAKSGGRTVPVGPDVIRQGGYLHEEYGGVAGRAGEGRLAHREGSLVVTGGWITQGLLTVGELAPDSAR